MALSQPAVIVLSISQHQCDIASPASHLLSRTCDPLGASVSSLSIELGENAASLHCNLACSQVLGLGCEYLWDWPLGGH